ncbi:hypothetical protein DICPUDRAFT_83551 [Dictyostelium purpureum]|uniref:Uncharacterized protein n=1 Tax=Dictyostelium purpureum TaxID=5786 RepID=F0ZZV2_DICPU|nr:uncharacterized protein DICPUDRAFT_83551 [Dictyostelium purpureum]EGC30530.1 hypothetical protein DICPUDRAFT_83551 [Dictyostelium purpureum]|eukprot:XP_003292953.1 hypothetical protein DICPUDRAFT_83551 [Dictyostelium purpureum]
MIRKRTTQVFIGNGSINKSSYDPYRHLGNFYYFYEDEYDVNTDKVPEGHHYCRHCPHKEENYPNSNSIYFVIFCKVGVKMALSNYKREATNRKVVQKKNSTNIEVVQKRKKGRPTKKTSKPCYNCKTWASPEWRNGKVDVNSFTIEEISREQHSIGKLLNYDEEDQDEVLEYYIEVDYEREDDDDDDSEEEDDDDDYDYEDEDE